MPSTISFTLFSDQQCVIKDKEKHIDTFEKLKSENVWQKDSAITKSVADSFSDNGPIDQSTNCFIFNKQNKHPIFWREKNTS